MSPQDDPSMKAAVIAAPRRLALIGAASFLVPLSLVVLAYGAIERRVSLQEQAKEMTPERSAQRIQVAGEPRPSAQTAVPQLPEAFVGGYPKRLYFEARLCG
jgi:hypothetical protein